MMCILYFQSYNGSDIDGFAVRMKTDMVPGMGDLRGIRGLDVDFGGSTYSIESRQSNVYEIKMDGETQDLSFENNKVRIFRASSLFVVIRGFGFTILFGPHRLYLVLHQYYHRKVGTSPCFVGPDRKPRRQVFL